MYQLVLDERILEPFFSLHT